MERDDPRGRSALVLFVSVVGHIDVALVPLAGALDSGVEASVVTPVSAVAPAETLVPKSRSRRVRSWHFPASRTEQSTSSSTPSTRDPGTIRDSTPRSVAPMIKSVASSTASAIRVCTSPVTTRSSASARSWSAAHDRRDVRLCSLSSATCRSVTEASSWSRSVRAIVAARSESGPPLYGTVICIETDHASGELGVVRGRGGLQRLSWPRRSQCLTVAAQVPPDRGCLPGLIAPPREGEPSGACVVWTCPIGGERGVRAGSGATAAR